MHEGVAEVLAAEMGLHLPQLLLGQRTLALPGVAVDTSMVGQPSSRVGSPLCGVYHGH